MSNLKHIKHCFFRILSIFSGTVIAICIIEAALNIFNYNYVPIKIQLLKEQDKWRADSQDKFNDDKNIRDLGRTDWRNR